MTSRVDVDVIAQPGRVETRARLPSRVLAASSRKHGLCCAGGTYRLSWLHCKYRAPRQSVYGYDQSGLARSRRSTNPLIPITELRIPAHIRSPHMHALHACVHTLHTASVRYVHLTQGRFSPLTEACPPTFLACNDRKTTGLLGSGWLAGGIGHVSPRAVMSRRYECP